MEHALIEADGESTERETAPTPSTPPATTPAHARVMPAGTAFRDLLELGGEGPEMVVIPGSL